MGGGRYGGNNMGIKDLLKSNYIIMYMNYYIRYYFPYLILGDDKRSRDVISEKYYNIFGEKINLNSPQTLNEKLQWLKLNVHENFYKQYVDKLAAREIWKKYGEEGLVPLVYDTNDYKKITLDKIPDYPCIVKCNTGCGDHEIIRDKSKVNINKLRNKCRIWMIGDYYYKSQEWQYKNIKPCIIIEKLLLDSNGHIPNDYKLHYINGELQFIYCSIDRESKNYRSIYSPEWERMNLEWVAKSEHRGGLYGDDIEAPKTLKRMIEIGNDIAKKFAYVRVDFYDVEGKLYYGEITLHHGSGFDTFEPKEYDRYFGDLLKLPLTK
jgi:hypothetical protein